MAKNQMKKCLWVLDTIYRTGGISYKDISARWEREHGHDELGNMANSTFRDYIKTLEDMFDVNIDCIASDGYKYRITSEHDLGGNNAKSWLLSSFAVNNLLSDNRLLEGRVVYEDIPSGQKFLITILEAMRQGLQIEVNYRPFYRSEASVYCVQPYAVKVDQRRWYLLAKSPNRDGLFHLALDRMERVEMTETAFTMDSKFDIDAYYDAAFGVIVDEAELDIEKIRVKVYNDKHRADYLRTLPLHRSQTEIEATPDFTIYEYRLRPTDDFRGALTALGGDAEVLTPAWFRDEVIAELQRALSRYSTE